MTWTVVWLKAARNHLADLWTLASDRQAVTDAANFMDRTLGQDPYGFSESRTGLTRIMIEPPLAILYDVSEPDCMVTVWAVWRHGLRLMHSLAPELCL